MTFVIAYGASLARVTTSPTRLRSKEAALRTSRLFRHLGDALVATVASSAVSRRFERGDLLWSAGDVAGGFTLIVSGLVGIRRRSPDGSAAIVALFGPREHIGLSATMAHGPYPADAVAASPTVEVLTFDAKPLLERSHGDSSVAEALNAELLVHTEALQEKIRIMTAGAVAQRLATLLLHLVERFGDDLGDGQLILPVALSRSELAQFIGATVETTIRSVSAWQKAGLIVTQKQGFVIRDAATLRRIALGA